MKNYFGVMVLLLLAMTACEHYDVNDATFTFNVVYKQSTFVIYDVYPSVNGFEYTTFVCTLDVLERLGTNGLIDSIFYTLDKTNTYTKGKRTVLNNLKPGTEYFMCCFRLDSRHEPVYQLVKRAFNTPEEEDLTIDVSLSARHDTIVVTPTSSQSYFWTFATLNNIRDVFSGNLLLGFYSELAFYENYDMLQYLVSIGESEDAVLESFPQLETGDTLVVAISPYNLRTGYCPSPDLYYLIYQDGTFEPIQKPGTQSAPGRMSSGDGALFGKDLILPWTKRKSISRR